MSLAHQWMDREKKCNKKKIEKQLREEEKEKGTEGTERQKQKVFNGIRNF